jgi:hypothetical protein
VIAINVWSIRISCWDYLLIGGSSKLGSLSGKNFALYETVIAPIAQRYRLNFNDKGQEEDL